MGSSTPLWCIPVLSARETIPCFRAWPVNPKTLFVPWEIFSKHFTSGWGAQPGRGIGLWSFSRFTFGTHPLPLSPWPPLGSLVLGPSFVLLPRLRPRQGTTWANLGQKTTLPWCEWCLECCLLFTSEGVILLRQEGGLMSPLPISGPRDPSLSHLHRALRAAQLSARKICQSRVNKHPSPPRRHFSFLAVRGHVLSWNAIPVSAAS